MFLKSKIGLTILSLYEIAAVLLLHCPRTCDAMFGAAFCDDHIFKYFVACIAVPLLVFLIAMWIMDIIHRIRRRHSLLYKARHAVKNMASNIRDRVSESVSSGDVEKMISAALLIGLKKYSDRNPRARQILNEIAGRMDIDEYADVEYDEYDGSHTAPQKSKTKKRKK